MSCPNNGCHGEWTTKRPSEWTEEEKEHVRRLVKGSSLSDGMQAVLDTHPPAK